MSFVAGVLKPLVPSVVRGFGLDSLTVTKFVPASFFLTCTVVSVPTKLLVSHCKRGPMLFYNFLVPFVNAVLFTYLRACPVLLTSSFVVKLNVTVLRAMLGPLRHAMKNRRGCTFITRLTRFVFNVTSFLDPLICACLVQRLGTSACITKRGFLLSLLTSIAPERVP